MAEEKESLIIEINAADGIENLAKLNAELENLKKNKAELQAIVNDESKANDIRKEAAKNLEAVNIAIKQQTQEYKTQQNILNAYVGVKKREVDTVNLSNNSIKTNRELLKQLTAQYIELEKPPKELTDKIKTLSDTLKQQEGAIGDTRRNVGNYKNDILDAIGNLQIFGTNIQGTIGGIKGFTDGIAAAGGGIRGLGAVISANPLGLILLAVTQMINLFKEFKPLVEFIEDQMAGLKAVGSVVNNYVLQAKDALTAFFQALDPFSDETDKITASSRKITISFQEAYEAGIRLRQEQRRLEDANRDLVYITANLSEETLRLNIASKDRTKGTKDRLDILDKLGEAEKKLLDEQRKIAVDEYALAQSKIDIELRSGKKLEEINDDLVKSRADAFKKLSDIYLNDVQLQETISNRRSQLLEQDRQDRISILDREERLLIARGEDTAKKLIAIEKQRMAILLENENLTAMERSLIVRESAQKVFEIKNQYYKKEQDALIRNNEIQARISELAGENNLDQLIQIELDKKDLILKTQHLSQQEQLNLENETQLKIIELKNEAAKKAIENVIRVKEAELNTLKLEGETTVREELALEDLRRDLLLQALSLTEEQRNVIIQNAENKKLQIIETSIKNELNALAQSDELFAQSLQQNLDTQVKAGQVTTDQQIAIINNISELQIEALHKRRDALLANTAMTEQERMNIITDFANKELALTQGTADKTLAIWKNAEIQRATAVEAGSNAVIGFIGKVAQAAGAAAQFQKVLAFTQLLINQAIAISNAVVGATASGAATGPGAIVATPLFIATLIGSVLAVFGGIVDLVTNADVPDTPKIGALGGDMSLGIEVGGRPHSQGGTQYWGEDGNRFELEANEGIYVMKKDAYQALKMYSAWNKLFGGRSWLNDTGISFGESGGKIKSDGGYFLRDAATNSQQLEIIQAAIREFAANIPAPPVS